MGIPPVGCTEKPDFLVRGQLVNQVGDGRIQEGTAHGRHGTESTERAVGVRGQQTW